MVIDENYLISTKSKIKPRVLIFHPALAPYRLGLFNSLASYFNFRVVFLQENLVSQKFNQSLLKSQIYFDYRYLKSGFKICKRSFKFGIWSQIHTFKPDVVITPEFSPVTIAVTLRKMLSCNFKHFVWADDNPESILWDTLPRRIVRRLIIPQLDGLIMLSDETFEHYRLYYGSAVPSAIVPILQPEEDFQDKLISARDTAIDYINQFGLNHKRVVMFVGRLSHEKRIDLLIKAFAGIASQIEDAVIVLIGDGNERLVLEQLAENHGIVKRVIFAGRHEGSPLAAWYRIGSIFVLPSEFECFGAVVNEALLAGMPVICSNRAGARILIREGVNGSVVDPENMAALQMALSDWLIKCPPVLVEQMNNIRLPLMPIQFQDGVDSFVDLVNKLLPLDS